MRANVSKIRVMSGFLGFFFGVFLDLPLGGCFVVTAGPSYQGPWDGCANVLGSVLSGPRLVAQPIVCPIAAVLLTYLATRSMLAIADRR